MSDILNRTISWEEGDMGATRDDFIKYPRTPHLFGSKGTDDDKQLGRKESEAFFADPSAGTGARHMPLQRARS